MLKKICRLFLGLMVCTGSVCVTPTRTSSVVALGESSAENFSIVIAEIQVGGSAGAKDEMVAIYNNGSKEVEITNWCLVNKSLVAFACFAEDTYQDDDGQTLETHFILPAYSLATVASREYLTERGLSDTFVTVAYDVTSQSSGSLVGSSDTVSLVSAGGDVIDAHTWSVSPPSGKVMQRIVLHTMPTIYSNTGSAADWMTVVQSTSSMSEVERQLVVVEQPQGEENSEGSEGDETDENASESDPHVNAQLSPIIITELFPNPAGLDAGKEFIELYNPTETTQNLDGLKLRIGVSTPKWYVLPEGSILPPHTYRAFFNSPLGFTLVNTNGGVQLFQTIGSQNVALSEMIEYVSPKDDMSWAIIDGVWQYTSTPTPGAQNLASPIKIMTDTNTSTQKPCAANQFRNPQTGRCKLISTALTTLTPCKVGQVRSPETNRCRSVTSSAKPQTPCKEGQERNLETNRCRNVKTISNADYGVKGVQTKAGESIQWYYWTAIIGIASLIIGYAIWEWRDELMRAGKWVRARVLLLKQ